MKNTDSLVYIVYRHTHIGTNCALAGRPQWKEIEKKVAKHVVGDGSGVERTPCSNLHN